MKKKSIVIAIISVIIIVGIIIFVLNMNKNIISKEQTVHNVRFYNASIFKRDGKYILKLSIDGKVNIDNYKFDADVKDKKGKSLYVFTGFITDLKKEDSLDVEMETDKDLKKAYQITYTVYKE